MTAPRLTVVGHCTSTTARILCAVDRMPDAQRRVARLAWRAAGAAAIVEVELANAPPYEQALYQDGAHGEGWRSAARHAYRGVPPALRRALLDGAGCRRGAHLVPEPHDLGRSRHRRRLGLQSERQPAVAAALLSRRAAGVQRVPG